jgi:hypothetical protein
VSGDTPQSIETTGRGRTVVSTYVAPTLVISAATLACAVWLGRSFGDTTTFPPAFYYLFSHQEFTGSIMAAGFLGLAFVLARRVEYDSVQRRIAAIADRPLVFTSIVVTVLALASLVVHHAHPLTMDEYSVVFQSQVFAAGKLHGQLPPSLLFHLVPSFWHEEFFIVSPESGRIVQAYWPTFALLLAPFSLLGVSWLLNPLLAGGSLLLVRSVARKLFDDPAAPGWAVLLTVASPAFTANAITYYTMNAHLFFNLLYVALLLEITPKRLFLAGVVGSLALTIQHPVPHMLFSVPWFVYVTARRGGVRNLAILCAGYLPLCLILGVGWLFVRIAVADPTMAVGSGGSLSSLVRRGLELGGSKITLPFAKLVYARLLGILKVFSWAAPGLPILAILGFGAFRRQPALRALAWSAGCVLVGFFFVPYTQGHGWGFRFFHAAWIALPLLAAGFLGSRTVDRAHWTKVVGLAAAASLVIGTAVRFSEIERLVSAQLDLVPQCQAEGRRVTFLSLDDGYYIEDLIQNDPFLRSPDIRMLSGGPHADAVLMRAEFPAARKVCSRGQSTVWSIGPGSDE